MFIPAKGLIRDLSANSSNIAFEVQLVFRGGNLALYHISIPNCIICQNVSSSFVSGGIIGLVCFILYDVSGDLFKLNMSLPLFWTKMS